MAGRRRGPLACTLLIACMLPLVMGMPVSPANSLIYTPPESPTASPANSLVQTPATSPAISPVMPPAQNNGSTPANARTRRSLQPELDRERAARTGLPRPRPASNTSTPAKPKRRKATAEEKLCSCKHNCTDRVPAAVVQERRGNFSILSDKKRHQLCHTELKTLAVAGESGARKIVTKWVVCRDIECSQLLTLLCTLRIDVFFVCKQFYQRVSALGTATWKHLCDLVTSGKP